MVIGNGLLAKSFSKYKDDDQVIIFASGVSNSKEVNPEAFMREMDLLRSITNKDALLVYFSTCSVYDWPFNSTPYVGHKINMEALVGSYFPRSIVFRIPTVVGNTNNPNTFFSFFKNQINSGEKLIISPGTTRYLIGVDELVETLSPLIDELKDNEGKISKKINVSFDNKTEALHLVTMMMQIMGKTTPIEFAGFGSSYNIKNKEFKDHLKKIKYRLPENYTYNLLKKYL